MPYHLRHKAGHILHLHDRLNGVIS